MTTDVATVLRSSGFFSRVSDELIDRISRMSRMEAYDKGDRIFADDTPCTGMYVVAAGAIKIYKIGPDGREHVIHIAEPGETFGEAAIFLGSRGYPAYAGAVKNSSVVFIPKRPLLELLGKEPELCFQLLGSLAMWTHRLVTKLELLTLKDASSRLAEYILGRAKDAGPSLEFDLTIPKHTVAAQLAITSETLSRLLNRLEAQGLIESEGRHMRVLDQARLQEVAEWGAQET
jgi:CRP/FNR family transcriptional regulator